MIGLLCGWTDLEEIGQREARALAHKHDIADDLRFPVVTPARGITMDPRQTRHES
jgi:hypothetical protein